MKPGPPVTRWTASPPGCRGGCPRAAKASWRRFFAPGGFASAIGYARSPVQHRGGMMLNLATKSGPESYGAVAMAIKRYGNKLACDTREAARMHKMMRMLNVKL